MSQTEELSRREEQFLENVLENLRQRIGKIAQNWKKDKKILRVCMNITGKITQRWTSTAMKTMIISRLWPHRINANQEKLDLKHRFQKMLDSPFFRESGFYL